MKDKTLRNLIIFVFVAFFIAVFVGQALQPQTNTGVFINSDLILRIQIICLCMFVLAVVLMFMCVWKYNHEAP